MILIITLVAVDRLYVRLYMTLKKELINLNIGHAFDKRIINYMNDLSNAIEYLRFVTPKHEDAIKIIEKYDRD